MMPRQIKTKHGDAFPFGALVVGEISPMTDFDAKPDRNGNRPQAVDKDTGLPVWTVDVMDADPEVRKANRTVSVRILAKVQPVPPAPMPGMPEHLAFMRPVEFEDLTASPYVADSPMGGGKGRLAWSFRCTGLKSPEVGIQGAPAGGADKSAKKAAA